MSAPPRDLIERLRVYNTPGAPNRSTPAQPGMAEQIAAKLLSEYVAGGVGGSGQWFANLAQTLPWAIDDVSGDFGPDLYGRMLCDPQIASVVNLFKASVLENGLEVSPALDDADADGYALGVTIADAAARMLDDLRDPDLDAILWNLMDAVALGHRVAEQVYALDTIAGKEALILAGLRVKPPTMLSFVVDSFMRLLGLVAYIPGVGAPLMQGYLIDPKATPNLLPRDKFVVHSFRPHDSDPRGTSILRPAFTAWNNKQAIIREHVKYLTQFASPSLLGITPENAIQPLAVDAEGNYTAPTGGIVTPEQALMNQLLAFKNGTALVAPYGTTITPLFSQGTGEAFISAMALWDSQIVTAILSQTLATEEGAHQARAAASVHQDVLDTIIRQGKRSLCKALRQDALIPWVRYNWGDDAARTLTPKLALGHAEDPDLPALWSAAAALKAANYLAPSQYQALDAMVNLPTRTGEETARLEAQAAAPPPAPIPGARPGQPAADEGTGDGGDVR